jgi:predicted RNase H-like HicB family nuclease
MRESEHHYEVVIRWSGEDQAYIAPVTELPGCMADGPTYSQAMANIERVMSEWIDTARELGREIPLPMASLA